MPSMWLRRSTSRARTKRKMADDDQGGSTPPSKKRPSSSKSESPQRSPNIKRKRTQADRYQSDVVDAISKHSKSRTPASAKKELYFNKGAYLAVRSEGGFFLCQTLKYVYDKSRTIQIQWLEETKPNIYKMSFLDFVDRDSVLTQVQLKPAGERGLKKLPEGEVSRIDKILNLSVKKEKGQLSDADGLASLDRLAQQIADGRNRKKPIARVKKEVPKKKAAVAKAKTVVKRARKVASASKQKAEGKGRRKAAGAKKAEKKGGKGAKKKEAKGGRAKKDPNSKLNPNPKIEVVSKDPMFEVKNETSMPQVSTIVHCKRAIRAVLTNDMPLLKKLISNTKGVPSVFVHRSVAVEQTAFDYALKANNQQCLKALLAEMNSKTQRVSFPRYSLQKENTGSYNYISLGHAVRALNVARGGKEGNNAFLKDNYGSYVHDNQIANSMLEYGCSLSTMDMIMREKPGVKDNINQHIYIAVRHGHRKLAGELIKRTNQAGGFGFNKLHEEVLLCDKPDEISQFRAVSVKKKPWDNVRIMPLHCAAINPNPKILEKLLSQVPDINAADQRGRKVIHYAAACTGSGPLESLLNRSAFADETDNQGNTPLMLAAELNRTQNIEILAKKLKSEETGGVLRKNVSGYTPLHYAAMNGHNDSVRALIKHGANIHAMLSAGKNKLTPFMLACERGHFQTVKLLADSGAILDQRDKLKRTALTLAVMNGQYPVAAFLLRKGVDPNSKDSSGNTPLHYAAGYGWWFALKLLLSAGADPNALNDWKVPPLAIAFMKGHGGCADLLLEEPGVDVNFRDSDGWTIIMLTVGSLTRSMVEQLKHLVEDKKADASLKDANDWNALHHLAANDIRGNEETKQEQRKISIEMATILMDHGCDPLAKNSNGETPLDIAVKKPDYNADFLKFLLENGGRLTNFTNNNDENMLHLMAQRCINTDQTELFKIVVENRKKSLAKDKDLPNDTAAPTNSSDALDVKELAKAKDKSGFTPLLKWAEVYVSNCNRPENQLEQARAFLKCLLDEADSDVNEVMRKDKHRWDGSAMVHMLASAAERAGKCISTGQRSDYPALEQILRYKPHLKVYDRDGRSPFHLALRANRANVIHRLVKEGMDPTDPSRNLDEDQRATPLIHAIRTGQFDLVDTLLTPNIVNTRNEKNKQTPLHCAVLSSHGTVDLGVIHIVKKLLAKRADVNAKDVRQRTPLHFVCRSYIKERDPSTDLIELLLDSGADVFACDDEGRLPLHYLFINMDNESDTAHIDPIEAVSIMTQAMKRQQLDKPDKKGRTPLHAAALRGATISIMLIAEKVKNIDVKDNLGNTPLVMATVGGHVSVVIYLLQQNANINVNVGKPRPVINGNQQNVTEKEHFWEWKQLTVKQPKPVKQNYEETLFRAVVRNNWKGIMFLLMDRLERFKVSYITPIKAAIEEHQFQMALNVISKCRENHRLSEVTSKQQNLLHIVGLSSAGQNSGKEVKVAEKLIAKGLRVGSDKYGCNPLTYAILAQHLPLCRIFLEQIKQQDGRQAMTKTDKKGRNLLAAALWRQQVFHEDIVSLLVAAGASLDMLLPLPVWQVEGQGAVEVGNDVLEEWYHLTDHPTAMLSPLILAIRSRHFHLVKFMLKKGADPNFPGADSLTPLMHCVKENDIDRVKVLLNYDYDPTKKNLVVQQPVHLGRAPQPQRTLGAFGVSTWKKPNAGGQNSYDEDEDDDEDEEDEENEDDEDMDDNEDDNMENDEEDDGDGDEDMDTGDQKKGKPETKEVPFQQTSSVNLSATDSKGRTAIHHLMRTCDYGTYQNVEILELLSKLGAPLDTKDNDGKTPLDYALETGSSIMAEALQKQQNKKKPQMVMPSPVKSGRIDTTDWTSAPSIDYREDSEKLLEKARQDAEKNMEELPKYPKPKVDRDTQLQESGEVLMDEDQDIPYNILMTKVDVKYGIYGFNNFYKMQVVFAKGKDMYVLLTRWGRIGTTGQYQRTPFGNKEEAVKEFCKIFKAKSGNDWSKVKQFSKLRNKYKLVETDPYYDRRTVKTVEFNFKSDKISRLPQGTQSLLETLTSVDMLKHGMKQSGASERLLPFGHLKGDVIAQGYDILKEIRKLLAEAEELDKDPANPRMDRKQEVYDRMLDLSSEFYQMIPNDNFSYDAMQPLDNKRLLDEAERKLADMSDLELTGKIMLAAQHRVPDVNPLDYIYRSLDCEIVPMEEDDVMSQLILKQMHNTCQGQNQQVQRIYRIRRRDEEEDLAKCSLQNHKLLWHGTKPFNVISILKRGLLVAPMGAPVTGSLHGIGIYHADMLAKSLGYCSNYGSPCKSNFLFLSEVALGTSDEGYNTSTDQLKKGCSSLKSCGNTQPNPDQDLLLPMGAVLPVGAPKERNRWGSYSEYVVYKESQVCLRYLVQIKA